jgi:hypothetical protein
MLSGVTYQRCNLALRILYRRGRRLPGPGRACPRLRQGHRGGGLRCCFWRIQKRRPFRGARGARCQQRNSASGWLGQSGFATLPGARDSTIREECTVGGGMFGPGGARSGPRGGQRGCDGQGFRWDRAGGWAAIAVDSAWTGRPKTAAWGWAARRPQLCPAVKRESLNR